MDSFYIIVSLIAIVILIICLIIIGIMLQKNQKTDVFPPKATTCPDGWIINGNTCAMGNANVGDENLSAYKIDPKGNNIIYTVDSLNNFTFLESAVLCDRQKWANNHGIKWDGVTNYTKC